jgi:glucokinase
MSKNIALGVDIGGSHITSGAVDLSTGILLRDTLAERDVDSNDQAYSIISAWGSCIRETLGKVTDGKVTGIGFAMPGPFDYVRGVALFKGVPKFENLYGFNISDAIRSTIEVPDEFPVRFMNDASAFAVAESWTGKAKGTKRSVSITLGTGFGSAFIEGNIPVVDGPDVPKMGCVWHLPFRDGIADEYFSTRWFVKEYAAISGITVSGVKELAEKVPLDLLAGVVFKEFGVNLATFLAPWLMRFGAEVLVIGGNISHAWNLFGDPFTKMLAEYGCHTRTEISDLKQDAALLGSAYLLEDKFWQSVQHALPLM